MAEARGSRRTSNRSRSDDNGGDSKLDKTVFPPHCVGKTQGATCDTVKKQITCDARSEHKFGNDPAESLENNEQQRRTVETLGTSRSHIYRQRKTNTTGDNGFH